MAADYRHHYSMLNDSQKSLYESLYKKVCSCGDSVKLPLIHVNEIWIAFEAMLLDNPWIFYTESYKYSKDLNKRRIIVLPEYRFPAKHISRHQSAVSSSLSFIEAARKKSDYEKVLFLHDYILDTVKYDFSADSHTVVGVAVNKSGVCEGIAKYVKLALDALSLRSIVVTGRATNPAFEQDENEPHAWNMVEVDGKWYHLDVTFDLTIKHKENRYDYFLVRDGDIRNSHSSGNKLPPTSATAMDYYSVNKLAASNLTEAGNLIHSAIASGQQVIQLKLLNVSGDSDPSEAVLQEADRQCRRILSSRGYAINIRYNNSLWVFEIEIS